MNFDLGWLVGFQLAEFAKSKRRRILVGAIQGLILLVAFASVFVEEKRAVFVIGGLALLLAVGLQFALRQFRQSREIAERARRATLLMGGLGTPLPNAALRDLWMCRTTTDAQAIASKNPNYFDARVAPGRERLAQMLEESAFWTTTLQKKSAEVCWLIFTLGLVAAFSSLLFAPYTTVDVITSGGRVIFTVLAFVVTQGLFDIASGHQSAASSVEKILDRLSACEARGNQEGELLQILGDYNSIVERAPLNFPWMYDIYKDQLNAQWAARP